MPSTYAQCAVPGNISEHSSDVFAPPMVKRILEGCALLLCILPLSYVRIELYGRLECSEDWMFVAKEELSHVMDDEARRQAWFVA